jgi:hypothetical protein
MKVDETSDHLDFSLKREGSRDPQIKCSLKLRDLAAKSALEFRTQDSFSSLPEALAQLSQPILSFH